MKKLVLVIFALAATMTVPESAQSQTYNWTGVYAGAGIGSVNGRVDRFYPNFALVHLPPLTFTTRDQDTLYSAHFGAQWQFGHLVLGVEGTYSRPEDQLSGSVSVSPPEPFTTLSAFNQLKHLYTIGPRIGYAADRLLIFGTGGYAAGQIRGAYICTDTGQAVFPGTGTCGALFGALATQNFTGTTWNGGWFLGGGFDVVVYQFSLGDVILGAEYQHFDLRQKTAFCFSPGCAIVSMQDHVDFQHGAKGDILRLRLTLKTNVFGAMLGQ